MSVTGEVPLRQLVAVSPTAQRVLGVIFGVTLVETIFQTLLPVVLTELRGASGTTVGLCISLAQGAAILLSAPAARLIDTVGPPRVVLWSCVAAVVSLGSLAFLVLHVDSELWMLAVGAYGVAKGVMMLAALSQVAALRNQVGTQGRNSAVQRGAAVTAVLISASIIASRHWALGLWLTATLSFATLMTLVLGRGRLRRRNAADRGSDSEAQDGGSVRNLLGGYGEVGHLLRRRPEIRASALVNVNSTFLFVLGNSFLPVVLVGRTSNPAVWIVIFMVGRDSVAVCAALRFARLTRRIGLPGVLLVVAVSTALSLTFIALRPSSVPLLVAAAITGGIALGLSIGATNLLALGTGEAVTIRLSATMHVNFAASLVLPILAGSALDTWGPSAMFALAAATTVGVAALFLHQARSAVVAGGSPHMTSRARGAVATQMPL